MPEDEFRNRPPGGWTGVPVAPWVPDIYGPGRKFIWGNQFTKVTSGQFTKQFIRIEGLSAPMQFALHLRIVGDPTPLTAKWSASFGVQGGPLTVNLFSGNHVVWGDSLIVDLQWLVPLIAAPLTIIGFAAPAPGAPVGWQEG